MTAGMFEDIKDFHHKFGLEYNGPPRRLPDDLGPFRIGFIAEELAEYITPFASLHEKIVKDVKRIYVQDGKSIPLEKQFDALIDLVYVALGTAYMQGFDFDEGWRRVHNANMRKMRATLSEQSARGSVFDVVKPEGWAAPDLSDLVNGTHGE